jgi:hypothetical protein
MTGGNVDGELTKIAYFNSWSNSVVVDDITGFPTKLQQG